jgi:hypothetical protein
MALLFLVCSCAGPRAAAPPAEERALGARLEAVLYRGGPEGRIAGMTVARAPGGAIRVFPGDRAGGARDDAAVAAEIRARLASDVMLLARPISVDVDGGVARLQGALDGRDQAARAVLATLAVRGVRVVEATLSWIPPRDLARLRSNRR